MTRIHSRMLVAATSVALVIAMTQLAAAQRRGRGFGFGRFGVISSAQLATAPKVQSDLKLNDDQKAKAAEISEQLTQDRRDLFQGGGGGGDFAAMREKMQKLTSDAAAKLAAVLDDGQKKRLQEIYVQVNGTAALNDADVAAALKITDAQKEELDELRRAAGQDMRAALQDLQDASPEERAEKIAQLRRESDEKTLAALTADQREQFEKMKGEKIDVDVSQFRGRGRGRRGN